jgi:hypothetical protein
VTAGDGKEKCFDVPELRVCIRGFDDETNRIILRISAQLNLASSVFPLSINEFVKGFYFFGGYFHV